ncbi:alpha/beta-hydrolase [Stipitochalara longipes BDJ]|nr:alpha/beta-hydrolase [Stipitochalara longipes BDJ]
MRPYAFLAAAAPLVLAIPAPIPTPVAAPAPKPLPVPQGVETDPITGLVSGLISGVLSLGSLSSAVPAVISDLGDALDAASVVTQAIANGTILGTDVPAVVQKLFQAVKPTSTPTSVQQAISEANSAFGITSASQAPPPEQDILQNVVTLLLDGFTSSDLQAVIQGLVAQSSNNINPPVPFLKTFYNTVLGNAPFDIAESALRAAIYIPPGFTWGAKQPVLMSPGTGATGASSFSSNIGKLLAQESFADPVYLNIPQNLLNDAQSNAEYVAYALQYLYAMTSKKPAIVTWSQGSLDAQWAFKYWPSVPKIVTDHIAISPDYHGTVLAYILCPGFATANDIACVPSVIQQQYNSNFVTKLRSNGGDSAYVPTTTVYSLTDEIVQPQEGTAASGYLNDARGVGVSNTYLQGACLAQPAGLLYTHEGVLYNPVAYALVVDALQHTGPGSFSRVSGQCGSIVAPGLSLSDVIETEALIPLAVLNIFAYLPKVVSEPAIKAYATH